MVIKLLIKQALLASGLAVSFVASAQIPAELIQKYQSLTPEQQKAALNQASAHPPSIPQPSPQQAAPVSEPGVIKPLPDQTAGKEKTNLAEGSANEGTAAKLRPFGYDLFAGTPTTFAPAIDIPIQKDYILGPGDVIEVQLFGKENANYSLTVQRDGSIQFPELGPIQVVGLQFDDMRLLLQEQISKRMIGIQSAITMGPLRSIRIFVLGDARRPGSYSVSSLSTITNALFVSGGVAETGSLRKIQLKRRGALVATLDLYDLLLKGDTSRDTRLEPGDVIFIPPVASTVGVSGEIRRPAIYELMGTTSAMDLVIMAGGMISTSYPYAARIDRIDASSTKAVTEIDLTTKGRSTVLRDGDLLRIPSVLDRVEGAVFARGHFNRPDAYKWQSGMRVSDVLRSTADLQPVADLDFGVIVRESPSDRTVFALPYSPRAVLTQKKSESDLLLQARDIVYVFGLDKKRTAELDEVVDKLRLQARKTGIEDVVSIEGSVQIPGTYPLFKGMRIQDLVLAALNLTPNADDTLAILVRESVDRHEISTHALNLQNILSGGSENNLVLQPKDRLIVLDTLDRQRVAQLSDVVNKLRAQASKSGAEDVVSVEGSVYIPGTYPRFRGMRVKDLMNAALNLTPDADDQYSVLVRENKTRHEIFAITVRLDAIQAGDESANFPLEPKDQLIIFNARASRSDLLAPAMARLQTQARLNEPKKIVRVTGEVRFPGSYPLTGEMQIADLIGIAGGFSEPAYALTAEVSRATADQKTGYSVQPIAVDLTGVADGSPSFRLQADDTLQIRRLPNFLPPEVVVLEGEFRFPGEYRIVQGETLSGLIKRAGGLTKDADPAHTVFTRKAIREAEAQQLKQQKQQLERDIARLQINNNGEGKNPDDANQSTGLKLAQELAAQLSEVQSTGRMVVDLPSILEDETESDIRLLDGDKLRVGKPPQSVSVFGEVLYPTSHQYRDGISISSYIDRSGGQTQTADGGRTYLIRANGQIVASAINNWGWDSEAKPGDTIIVPLDTQPIDKLKLTTNIAQILSSLAITAASLNAVGAF